MAPHVPADRASAVANRLLILFGVGVLAIGTAVNIAAWVLWHWLHPDLAWPPALFAGGSLLVATVVFGRTRSELRRLGSSGTGLATRLGARPLDETDALHRRLREVTEEVAARAGIAVPTLFALDDSSINALAAGDRPAIAAVLVTRGALERLDRAQLQGVVATRIAQIVDGDAALNLRIAAALYGLSWVRVAGRRLVGRARMIDERGRQPVFAPAIGFAGAVVSAIGTAGAAAARLLRAGIGRERVFRADALGLLLTGDRDALVSALRRVITEQVRQSSAGQVVHRARHAEELELIGALLLVAPSGTGGRFAAHPPIDERIDRLRGRALRSGDGLAAPARWLARLRDSTGFPARRPAPPAGSAAYSMANSASPVPTEGLVWAETMAIAAEDRPAAVPLSATPAAALIARLRTAVVSRDDATRWLCVLVAGAAPAIGFDEPDQRVSAALRWLLSAEGAPLRVPVLEMMLARLRRWSSAHRREMLERCRRALEQAGRAESADWVLYTLARHRLLPSVGAGDGVAARTAAAAGAGTAGRAVTAAGAKTAAGARTAETGTSPGPGRLAHGRALAALFAMAASIGEASLRTTRDTLAETAALLDVAPPAATPDEFDTSELANALDLLVSLPAVDKAVLLRMLLRMVRTPGDPDFDAFIRAVAAAIDCPLPRAAPIDDTPLQTAGRYRRLATDVG